MCVGDRPSSRCEDLRGRWMQLSSARICEDLRVRCMQLSSARICADGGCSYPLRGSARTVDAAILCEDLRGQWMQLSSVRICADCGTQGVAGAGGVGGSLADFTHLLLGALGGRLGSHVPWRPWIVGAVCRGGHVLWRNTGTAGRAGCVPRRQCVAGVADRGGRVPRQPAWELGRRTVMPRHTRGHSSMCICVHACVHVGTAAGACQWSVCAIGAEPGPVLPRVPSLAGGGWNCWRRCRRPFN